MSFAAVRFIRNYRAEDGTVLRIRFSDRRSCLAAIIAADPRSDLAVLRLNWDETGIKPTDFPQTQLGNRNAASNQGTVRGLTRKSVCDRARRFGQRQLGSGQQLDPAADHPQSKLSRSTWKK